eukprot:Platyproteum_vivax@DN17537_c0_g1_i1.p2
MEGATIDQKGIGLIATEIVMSGIQTAGQEIEGAANQGGAPDIALAVGLAEAGEKETTTLTGGTLPGPGPPAGTVIGARRGAIEIGAEAAGAVGVCLCNFSLQIR